MARKRPQAASCKLPAASKYDVSVDLKDEQYGDGSKLNARIELHKRFSRTPEPWFVWLRRHLSGRILDIGCGTGAIWRENAPPDGLVLADFSLGMLRDAPDLPRVGADVQALPFAPVFDTVAANHMLYHVPDMDRALEEIHRVLRPGGRVVAATNSPRSMRPIRDLIRAYAWHIPFDLDSGPEVVARHFDDVEVAVLRGHLAITDADVVVRYALSLEVEIDAERLRAEAQQRIDASGHWRVDTEVGAVIGTKR